MPEKQTVTAKYAKANLPTLLNRVAAGETVTISRYNKPVADLVPTVAAAKPPRKFGTLKGKLKPVDPRIFAPMTDEEVDAFIAGRY
jgi:prevent-host-death family protein